MFRDRTEAGQLLAKELSFLKDRSDVIVLAIPRGGVPVAAEVAQAIGAPLDIVVVRKIGAPDSPELAIGAVSEGGEVFLDQKLIEGLGVSQEYTAREVSRKREEVAQRESYREGRPAIEVKGKTALIIDDGIATGSTLRAAVEYVRQRRAKSIIIAAPVGVPESISELSKLVEVVCPSRPRNFGAVGQYYEDFSQVDDAEVTRILREATRSP